VTPEGSAFKKDIVMRSEVLFVADRSNYRTVGVPKHMHNENWGNVQRAECISCLRR